MPKYPCLTGCPLYNLVGTSPRPHNERLFIASQPKQQKANPLPISEENWPSMSYAPISYLTTGCDGAATIEC